MTPEPTGLSEAAAAARLRAEGANTLPNPDHRGALRIVLDVLREPMFALLLIGGAVYLALGDIRESAVLVVFATLSVAIAVVQEYRSERVLEALRGLTNPQATVLRDGVRRRIASGDLVRGDVIAIAEGERAPADAILRTGDDIEADESLLTGESAPVSKHPSLTAGAMAPPGGEGGPFIYSGSLVVRGQGLAEIAATGPRTEIGRIGGALRTIENAPTRLSMETRRLVRLTGAAAFLVCAAVVLMTGLAGRGWLQGLLGGVALGMAMLPEEMPLVLTVFTVMGAWRLSRAHVLTRRAAAIETLGAATVLCTDKTGTLTQNRMTLAFAWTAGEVVEWSAETGPPAAAAELVRLGALASAPHPFDPMEQAFHAASASTVHDGWRLERSYGLTPDRPAMTQVWSGDQGLLVAVKGAPEAVMRMCRLEAARAAEILAATERMAEQGARVLAIAEARPADIGLPASPSEFALRFVGLVGLADPLRPDVRAAVAECQSAGVRVVMVTGDYPSTARAIAVRAGIADGGMLTGADLLELGDAQLAERIGGVTIFARILPEQKLRIVRALKAAGEVVAMTGDGVNDAPALKAADIGIAMGERGTDVARAAADLVLLDDDFRSIVGAMRLGRRIYDNLRKAFGFILAVHIPVAGLALFPLLLGLPPFLAPAHIAFLEMIIDPVCSIVFEAETEEADVMRRPPRDAGLALVTRRAAAAGVVQGLVVLAAVSSVYAIARAWGFAENTVHAIAFIALVIGVFELVVANRTFKSVFAALLRPNRALGLIAVVIAAAVVAVTTAPGLRALFHFGPMDLRGLLLAFAGGGASLVGLEILKSTPLGGRGPKPAQVDRA